MLHGSEMRVRRPQTGLFQGIKRHPDLRDTATPTFTRSTASSRAGCADRKSLCALGSAVIDIPPQRHATRSPWLLAFPFYYDRVPLNRADLEQVKAVESLWVTFPAACGLSPMDKHLQAPIPRRLRRGSFIRPPASAALLLKPSGMVVGSLILPANSQVVPSMKPGTG